MPSEIQEKIRNLQLIEEAITNHLKGQPVTLPNVYVADDGTVQMTEAVRQVNILYGTDLKDAIWKLIPSINFQAQSADQATLAQLYVQLLCAMADVVSALQSPSLLPDRFNRKDSRTRWLSGGMPLSCLLDADEVARMDEPYCWDAQQLRFKPGITRADKQAWANAVLALLDLSAVSNFKAIKDAFSTGDPACMSFFAAFKLFDALFGIAAPYVSGLRQPAVREGLLKLKGQHCIQEPGWFTPYRIHFKEIFASADPNAHAGTLEYFLANLLEAIPRNIILLMLPLCIATLLDKDIEDVQKKAILDKLAAQKGLTDDLLALSLEHRPHLEALMQRLQSQSVDAVEAAAAAVDHAAAAAPPAAEQDKRAQVWAAYVEHAKAAAEAYGELAEQDQPTEALEARCHEAVGAYDAFTLSNNRPEVAQLKKRQMDGVRVAPEAGSVVAECSEPEAYTRAKALYEPMSGLFRSFQSTGDASADLKTLRAHRKQLAICLQLAYQALSVLQPEQIHIRVSIENDCRVWALIRRDRLGTYISMVVDAAKVAKDKQAAQAVVLGGAGDRGVAPTPPKVDYPCTSGAATDPSGAPVASAGGVTSTLPDARLQLGPEPEVVRPMGRPAAVAATKSTGKGLDRKKSLATPPGWLEAHVFSFFGHYGKYMGAVMMVALAILLCMMFPPAVPALGIHAIAGQVLIPLLTACLMVIMDSYGWFEKGLMGAHSWLFPAFAAALLAAVAFSVVFVPVMPAVLGGVMSASLWHGLGVFSLMLNVPGFTLLFFTLNQRPEKTVLGHLKYWLTIAAATLLIMPSMIFMVPGEMLALAVKAGVFTIPMAGSKVVLASLYFQGMAIGAALNTAMVAAAQVVGLSMVSWGSRWNWSRLVWAGKAMIKLPLVIVPVVYGLMLPGLQQGGALLLQAGHLVAQGAKNVGALLAQAASELGSVPLIESLAITEGSMVVLAALVGSARSLFVDEPIAGGVRHDEMRMPLVGDRSKFVDGRNDLEKALDAGERVTLVGGSSHFDHREDGVVFTKWWG